MKRKLNKAECISIKKHLLDIGKKQKEAAKEIGCHYVQFNYVINGQRNASEKILSHFEHIIKNAA